MIEGSRGCFPIFRSSNGRAAVRLDSRNLSGKRRAGAKKAHLLAEARLFVETSFRLLPDGIAASGVEAAEDLEEPVGNQFV